MTHKVAHLIAVIDEQNKEIEDLQQQICMMRVADEREEIDSLVRDAHDMEHVSKIIARFVLGADR